MNWYYARGDDRMGPVSAEEILTLVDSGVVTSQTLVWRDGMADWASWNQAPQPLRGESGAESIATTREPTDMQPCRECGRTFRVEEMVIYGASHICGDCKPTFFQRLREGGDAYGETNYAGFWIRFCAWIVDLVFVRFAGALVAVVQISLLGAFNPDPGATDIAMSILFMVIGFAIPVGYHTWFVGRFGATPGKMILHLRVVRSDGSPLSYWRALGRYFGGWLSWMTLLIGFVIAGFDAQKRALHDHICDTRVIHG